MLKRWMLTQFFTSEGRTIPVCSAYGSRWLCPCFPPEGGWALVHILTSVHQIEAARQDDRVLVCPMGNQNVPLEVVDAYSYKGITLGMTMYQVFDKLAETEPLYETGMEV
jgi:hypothetical protein